MRSSLFYMSVLGMFVLCSGLVAKEASARSVYLNGFDISDVRNQTFEKAKITIDKDGNVRIDAPQYDVKVVPPSTSALNDRGGPNAALKNKYYLATQPAKSGKVQYDFVVKVNGKERRLVKADGPQLILEISAWLKKGENEVVVTAKKNMEGGRKSYSADDKASILVGLGHEDAKIVKIDAVKADVKVDGGSVQDVEKRFTIVAE